MKKRDSGSHPSVRCLHETLDLVTENELARLEELRKRAQRLLHAFLFDDVSADDVIDAVMTKKVH